MRSSVPGSQTHTAHRTSHAVFLVFDLDGTLIDGYDAIADALAYAMEKFGLRPLPPARVRVLVGHGIEKLLESAVGSARAPEGVRLFRERYPRVAIEKTRLMPGVPAVLAELSGRGHEMAVASNKPERFSRMILEACGVGGHFVAVAGPDRETPTKPHPAMLLRLMAGAGTEARDTVVIGDMEVDSEFARAAGCRVVLIASGSRTRRELLDVDADALLDTIADLPGWLRRPAQSRKLPTES